MRRFGRRPGHQFAGAAVQASGSAPGEPSARRPVWPPLAPVFSGRRRPLPPDPAPCRQAPDPPALWRHGGAGGMRRRAQCRPLVASAVRPGSDGDRARRRRGGPASRLREGRNRGQTAEHHQPGCEVFQHGKKPPRLERYSINATRRRKVPQARSMRPNLTKLSIPAQHSSNRTTQCGTAWPDQQDAGSPTIRIAERPPMHVGHNPGGAPAHHVSGAPQRRSRLCLPPAKNGSRLRGRTNPAACRWWPAGVAEFVMPVFVPDARIDLVRRVAEQFADIDHQLRMEQDFDAMVGVAGAPSPFGPMMFRKPVNFKGTGPILNG